MHLTRDSNELLSHRRNSIGFSTLPFAFPNEPSYDLIEGSWNSQLLSIAPDRAVNRVYLGTPTALQILQHRARVIVRGRDQVTIEKRAIVIHCVPQQFDAVCFGHKEGFVNDPIHDLP